jgi:hypothetical protein
MRIPSRPMSAAIAASVAALAVAGVARAGFSDAGAPSAGVKDVTPVAFVPLASVPAEQANLFGALRQPAAAAIPAAVRAQFVSGAPGIATVGADVAQARSVSAGGRSFYVVPGSKGICLVLEDGVSACSDDLAAVARNGLSVAEIPPASGPVKGMDDPVGPGTVITYGLVPDGTTGVAAAVKGGDAPKAEMTGNAYVIETDAPLVSATLEQATSR